MVVALLLGGLLLVSVAANLQLFVSAFVGPGGGTSLSRRGLEEVTLESHRSRNKIAVLDVRGMILSDGLDRYGLGLVSLLKDQLRRAAEDSSVKALVLRIDSPGGEVLAADEISGALRDFQKESGKPVVASMGSLAASGGYYVAVPCQWIVANELTITGSIGVIMHGYNYRGLLDKVGVRPQVYKSGRYKDMLSPDKAQDEITSEEQEMLQNLIDRTFQRFKEVVREGRARAHEQNGDTGRKLNEGWQELADGRILSGREAWEAGFVDELGNFETAVRRAELLADVSGANLVQYQRPFTFGNLFRLFGGSETRTLKLDLGVDIPQLRPGYLYYILPMVVR
jgi:protease-4